MSLDRTGLVTTDITRSYLPTPSPHSRPELRQRHNGDVSYTYTGITSSQSSFSDTILCEKKFWSGQRGGHRPMAPPPLNTPLVYTINWNVKTNTKNTNTPLQMNKTSSKIVPEYILKTGTELSKCNISNEEILCASAIATALSSQLLANTLNNKTYHDLLLSSY